MNLPDITINGVPLPPEHVELVRKALKALADAPWKEMSTQELDRLIAETPSHEPPILP